MQPSKLALLSVAVSSAMALSACSNGLKFGDKQNLEPLNNKVNTVLDKDVLTDITVDDVKTIKKVGYNDESKLEIQVSNDNHLADKKVGDIVRLPATSQKHSDMVVVITQKEVSSGVTTLTTRYAQPHEAFDKIQLQYQQNDDFAETQPKVAGIIMPNGEFITANAQQKHSSALQAGLIPTVKVSRENEGGKTSDAWKISMEYNSIKTKVKAKDVSKEEYKALNEYCQTFKDGDNLTPISQQLYKDNCETGIKLSGEVKFKPPKLNSNLNLEKQAGTDLFDFVGSDLQYINYVDGEIEGEIKGELWANEKRLSDLMSKDHVELLKKFESKQIGSPESLAYAKLSGLSADDKKGKIPLFGLVLSFATGGGAIANDATVTAGSSAGMVVWFYKVIDAKAEGKIELRATIEPTKFSMGLKNTPNGWVSETKFYNLNAKDPAKAEDMDARLGIKAKLGLEYYQGFAVEADAFIAGVRLANAGIAPLIKFSGEVEANGYVSTSKYNRYGGDLCFSNIGLGFGIKSYADLNVQGNFKFGKSWFKVEGGAGFSYSGRRPDAQEEFDATNPYPLWLYQPFVKNTCFTDQKPEPVIKNLTFDDNEQKDGYRLALIDVANNHKGSIKEWKVSYQVNGQKYDKIVNLGNHETEGVLSESTTPPTKQVKGVWLPAGQYKVNITAMDLLGRQTTVSKDVDIKVEKPVTKIVAISTMPNELKVNETFELIITGSNLPTDNMFTVNGCNAQTKVSLAVDKHIYKCTAPANATDNYNLSVVGTDGKTTIFNKQFKVTATTVPPITPTATKLTATGITLCGDDSRNNIACNSLSSAWLGLMQDGEVQAGQKMDYELRQYNNETCVIDKVTGLTWEQKTDDGGLRDKDNQYTWYNPDNRTNGGNAGYKNNGKNTYEYIKQLNAMNYCGYSDWRLPTKDELYSIVDYSRYKPAINPIFIHTQDFYWSSSSEAYRDYSAWGVNFDVGSDINNDLNYGKRSDYHVRAVRSN